MAGFGDSTEVKQIFENNTADELFVLY